MNVSATPLKPSSGVYPLDGTNGFELEADGKDYFSFASVGTIRGGSIYSDILLPSGIAPGMKVVYGKADWTADASRQVTTAWLNGTSTRGFEILNSGTYSVYGEAPVVADVNKDGYPDIICGDYGINSSAGSVFVLFGPAGGWPASTTLNSAYVDGTRAVEFDGAAAGNNAGVSLATGDINGDGYPDILIGATGYTGSEVGGGVTGAGSVWGIWGQTSSVWVNSPVTNLSTVY